MLKFHPARRAGRRWRGARLGGALAASAVALMANAAVFTATPAQAAGSGITFVGTPGTSAPPSGLGPYVTQPFGTDPQPGFTPVSSVAGPTGTVTFSPSLLHTKVGLAWATWSNGYTGDVYTTGATSIALGLPAGTFAFYLYAEPQQFATLNITATTQDGTTSGAVPVNGQGGARYFGFYSTGSPLTSITVSTADPTGFAIGEFGIATGSRVALGDGYSSGEANPPFVAAEGSCDLSQNGAWPELIASAVAPPLTANLACSGATAAALTSSFKGQQAQLTAMQALSPAPDLATLTIGASDVGLFSALNTCHLFASICQVTGPSPQVGFAIQALGNSLPSVLEQAKADLHDGARLYVVGYPRLFPVLTTGIRQACPWLSGLAMNDFNHLVAQLDQTLSNAAATAGATYVPDYNALAGHELCTANSWVHPVSFTSPQYSGYPVGPGQQALANAVADGIAGP